MGTARRGKGNADGEREAEVGKGRETSQGSGMGCLQDGRAPAGKLRGLGS